MITPSWGVERLNYLTIRPEAVFSKQSGVKATNNELLGTCLSRLHARTYAVGPVAEDWQRPRLYEEPDWIDAEDFSQALIPAIFFASRETSALLPYRDGESLPFRTS